MRGPNPIHNQILTPACVGGVLAFLPARPQIPLIDNDARRDRNMNHCTAYQKCGLESSGSWIG
jgi:hypothetical protein